MTARGLQTRLSKLEVQHRPKKEALWALVRWRFPVPDRDGFVSERKWGWELRDRLGLGAPDELHAIVELGGDEPEIVVSPAFPSDLSAADEVRLQAAIDAEKRVWWLQIRGAFVVADELPRGFAAWLEEAKRELEMEQ